MKVILSICLLGIFGEIVRRQLQQLRQTIHFTIVTVKLLKLYRLGMICINILKDCLDFIVCEGRIKSLEDLLELFYRQLPTLVSIVSVKSLVKSEFL